MLSIFEFQKRAVEGPVMKTDEFDLMIARKVRQLLKKYEVKYDPEQLIIDDASADAIFQAGVELLAEVGMYHNETQRVIKLSLEEIEELVQEYKNDPQSVTFGLGKDEHTVVLRKPGDVNAPTGWMVAGGVVQQEWFVPYLLSGAQEEVVQGLGISGGVAAVDGIVAKEGTPSEIFCGLWEVEAQKEVLRLANRPGMHLGLIPTVTTPGGTAAVIGPGLREAHNSMIGIHLVPEQKLDWTRLNLAYFCQRKGISPWTSTMSLLGGLGGKPPGVAMLMITNLLGQLSYGRGRIASFYVNDMTGRASNREALWVLNACIRAAGRNLGVITGTCAGDSGPVFSVEERLVRNMAMAASLTLAGGGYNWGLGGDGLEARLQADLMKNLAPITGDKANEILQNISRLIDEMIEGGGTLLDFNAQIFPTRYDLETVKPLPEYTAKMKKVAEMLREVGVPLSSDLNLD